MKIHGAQRQEEERNLGTSETCLRTSHLDCESRFYVCVCVYQFILTHSFSPHNKVFPDMFLTMYSSSQWEETSLIFTFDIKLRLL